MVQRPGYVNRADENHPTYDIAPRFDCTQGGADRAAVPSVLVHSSAKLTADTYCEFMRGAKEKAVGLLSEVLSAPEQEQPGKLIELKQSANGKGAVRLCGQPLDFLGRDERI